MELAIAAHLNDHWRPTDLTIAAGQFIMHFDFSNLFLGSLDFLRKWLVELVNDLNPVFLAFFDPVQVVFNFGRKLDIDDFWELLDDDLVDDLTQLGWLKVARYQTNIVAALNGVPRWRVGGRPADPIFFQRLDQGSFRITSRRLREVLGRVITDHLDLVALIQVW